MIKKFNIAYNFFTNSIGHDESIIADENDLNLFQKFSETV